MYKTPENARGEKKESRNIYIYISYSKLLYKRCTVVKQQGINELCFK